MLLIWDIHIHPRYCDHIIDMLRSYIIEHGDEREIIFVWDYVYHFSYHRASLLALLDFFLELAQWGKKVYIVAGNHDRLGQHFVYAEAEKIVNQQKYSTITDNIHFITQPCVQEIDHQTVIFLPYILKRSEYTPASDDYSFDPELQWYQCATHTQSKASYMLNAYLTDTIQTTRISDTDKDLLVIHHYYIAWTQFPGMRAVFGYKDLALSPKRLDEKNIKLISWHMHHTFAYKNYLCIWAIRSTSPLETNQLNYLFNYKKDTTVEATQTAFNPYLNLTLEPDDTVDEASLRKHRSILQTQSQWQFHTEWWRVQLYLCDLPLNRTTISLTSRHLQYDTLSEHILPELQQTLREIKLKQDLWSLSTMIEDLAGADKNFTSWRSDRKILLDEYLERKFGERKQLYVDMLRELSIR
jgi:hypothetical protein